MSRYLRQLDRERRKLSGKIAEDVAMDIIGALGVAALLLLVLL